MKAYRNFGGDVREVQVDVDPSGKPILPPDTTVDPRPEPLAGHYVTVVGNAWVQIEIPVVVVSFETKKQAKLKQIADYTGWATEQPVDLNGTLFDGDEVARIRLTQALVMNTELGVLPPAWIAHDKSHHPLATVDDLRAISAAVHAAFQSRFFACDALRQAALAATNEAELDAVVVPTKPGAIA